MTEDAQEFRLEFPDNRHLIELFGEFNRNLAQIEAALEVQIVHQGNQLAIFGEAEAQKKSAQVLTALYQRIESGKEVTHV
ncbi:MAG: phosphate starvation-inducible protein PhoH, partial [Boseongicola sp.]|nr:phosphate starvation-inducible protein PhoH [Boseongicola sp.]